jgi:hypothetical protein
MALESAEDGFYYTNGNRLTCLSVLSVAALHQVLIQEPKPSSNPTRRALRVPRRRR